MQVINFYGSRKDEGMISRRKIEQQEQQVLTVNHSHDNDNFVRQYGRTRAVMSCVYSVFLCKWPVVPTQNLLQRVEIAYNAL